STGIYDISGNTIAMLSGSSEATGSGFDASVLGIANRATGSGLTIENNTIYGLSNEATADVHVVGISNTGNNQATNPNNITRNFIHSFSTASEGSRQTGILAGDGLLNITNNMIRLGID